MFHDKRAHSLSISVLAAVAYLGMAAQVSYGADEAAAAVPADQAILSDLSRASTAPSSQSATVNLINRLTARGVLTKQDSTELLMMAEADAAEARAQAALTQAAIAMASAAQARARAIAAMSGARLPAAQPPAEVAAPATPPDAEAAVADAVPDPAPAPSPKRVARTRAEAPPADDMEDAAPTAPVPAAKQAARAAAPRKVAKAVPAPAADDAQDEAPVPDDDVRVTYVPDYVKEQLRQEVTQDVLDSARKEGWATPSAVPSWVTKFTLFGDFRMRFEDFRYPGGNDNTGAFPNFNAINTGSPYNVSGSNYAPELNVDQNRDRVRIRARAGFAVDLGQNFSIGMRAATGNDDSPVSENQTLGGANSVQGGNFSKYAIWLDRAFLRYEVGGKPDEDLAVSLGRFDNPFMSTSMIWADDLGFDGVVVKSKYHFGEDVAPFLTVGAFPVFNTDLNFGSNLPAKYASYDKWLAAAQLGFDLDLGKDLALRLAVADYKFKNIEGQLSTPFIPLSSADIGNTDDSRPSFAQTGNTYMALRDITASPLNNNGTIDQYQYYGLASKFNEVAADARLDFNQFEPFQISLTAEYVKNTAFNKTLIAADAVNNRAASTTSNPLDGAFVGSADAWLVRMTLGDAVLQSRWDWNVNFGYRSVGSDAVVDGFADADFGGGGTNFKGPTYGGSLALSSNVWLRMVWMSASEVSGPTFKNDILQMDINAKF